MEVRNPYITKHMEWLFDKYVSIRDKASSEPRKGKRKRQTRDNLSLKGKSKVSRQAGHGESSAREPLASIDPICNTAMPFANQHEMEGGDNHHTIWTSSSTEAPLGAERIVSPDGSSNNGTVISGLSSMNNEVDRRNDEPTVSVGNVSNQGSNQFGCVKYGQVNASQQLCGIVDAPILFPISDNNPTTLNAGNDQFNNSDTYALTTSAVDYNNSHDFATFAVVDYNSHDLATFAFEHNNPHDLATFAFEHSTAYSQPHSCPSH
jgi:hypothetical protein